jgi:hypothetical protein
MYETRQRMTGSRARGFLHILALVAIVPTGCNGSKAEAEAAPPLSGSRIILTNLRTVTVDDWTLDTWTDASSYAPAAPIAIGVRLTDATHMKQKPKAELSVKCIQAGRETVLRTIHLTPELRDVVSTTEVWASEKGQLTRSLLKPGQSWQALLKDALSTDPVKPGAEALPEGEYLLEVEVIWDAEHPLKVKGMPIEIRRSTEE